MNQRGEYGRRLAIIGADPHYVPVIDLARVGTSSQLAAYTTRVALWDSEAELSQGPGPSYYTDRQGWWLYYDPNEGTVWLGGLRFRPVQPRRAVMVFDTAA